jgi:dynein heavy chain
MMKLYDALQDNIRKGEDEGQEEFLGYVEKWFVFAMIWSVCCTVDESSRKAMDDAVREVEPLFPPSHTIFEYFIKLEKRDFVNWETELGGGMKTQQTEFTKIIVPTIDTVRNRYIVNALINHGSQVLLIGQSGVGKTVLADGVLASLDHTISSFTINFSAGTTSNAVQEIIEGNFERRAKNKYKPKNAKSKVVCFIDDLNMPRRDAFGSQPPLELVRQWMDYECWYDRAKIVENNIQNLQILSSMGKPGGGRQPISNRLLSCFHTITYTQPSDSNMKRIFQEIITIKFTQFHEEIKGLNEPLAVATINIFNSVVTKFLPTPAKSHYTFNMRDISKVFQGVYQANKNYYETRESVAKLWAHETLRVFSDRLNNDEDIATFATLVKEQVEQQLGLDYEEHCTTDGIGDAIFVDFLNDLNEPIYQEVTDFEKLKDTLNEAL